MEGCTFTPTINRRRRPASAPRSRAGEGGAGPEAGQVQARLHKYKEARERKLEALRAEKEAKERAAYTFKPRVRSRPGTSTGAAGEGGAEAPRGPSTAQIHSRLHQARSPTRDPLSLSPPPPPHNEEQTNPASPVPRARAPSLRVSI